MDIHSEIDRLAVEPVLLVATDFDGTIAPIVPDPTSAEAHREALAALKMLAAMPNTHVAIISGRALADLAGRTAGGGGIHLVGSHGSEFEGGLSSPLPDHARSTLSELSAELERMIGPRNGFYLEHKTAAIALHYRNAINCEASEIIKGVLAGPAQRPGVHLRHGKQVIEFSVVETNKGEALRRLRQRFRASALIFLGDDVTDEDAFRALTGPDVGLKVGPGDTAAAYRVEDSSQVKHLLGRLAERRSAWVDALASPRFCQG